jgi:prepilin-type N-terminal cleavage/methylation domain-containing protein
MKRGFTLVELLVALALFGFVVVIAAGTMIVLSNSNLTAQVSRKAIDNIDFVFDDIVREARLGKNYHCAGSAGSTYDDGDFRNPSSCLKGSNIFAVTQVGTGDVIRYSTSTVAGKSVIIKEVIRKDATGASVASSTQLSANDISVNSLKFYVSGAEAGDGIPAQVFITLQAGLKKSERFKTTVDLQTTVAQREYDD